MCPFPVPTTDGRTLVPPFAVPLLAPLPAAEARSRSRARSSGSEVKEASALSRCGLGGESRSITSLRMHERARGGLVPCCSAIANKPKQARTHAPDRLLHARALVQQPP